MEVNEKEQRLEQLESGMKKLTARFVQTLPDHVNAFDGLWDNLAEPDCTEASVKEICSRAHKLHGQAGSFGFARIGALAAQVEKEALTIIKVGENSKTELLEELMAAMLDEIEDRINAA